MWLVVSKKPALAGSQWQAQDAPQPAPPDALVDETEVVEAEGVDATDDPEAAGFEGVEGAAAPEPVAVVPASAEDLPSAPVVSVVVFALSASGTTAGAAVPPFLKSVAYQPVPLSWKPGALNCLLQLSCPHAGHFVWGVSDIFCSTSLAWPQDPHL